MKSYRLKLTEKQIETIQAGLYELQDLGEHTDEPNFKKTSVHAEKVSQSIYNQVERSKRRLKNVQNNKAKKI